jgi:pilus assembly protein CpaF
MNSSISAYEIQKENTGETSTEINDNLFSHIDFGPLKTYLDDDNITDISYSNNGQVWLKSLDKGVYRVDNPGINNELMEKIAFQCANIMGKTFNMASPFLDSESSELRMNFVHDSIARNGIAAVFRKTPAKIRLKKEKIIADKYINIGIHDFLIDCVRGHCNIIVSGETGSGKTELVKYLASHTAENEKIVTIEDTLELHLDKIYPNRDIVAMKTNNIASYSDVLVTCMRQNPKWILLSEVRSAEAVTAVRNSISSGHNILSTIHADKAQSIPYRLYSLLESNIDVNQFMTTIYRYIQLGVHVRARYDKENGGFMREVCEVCEFHVTRDNVPEANVIYRKNVDGTEVFNKPSEYLIDYLEGQGMMIKDKDYINVSDKPEEKKEGIPIVDPSDKVKEENVNNTVVNNTPVAPTITPTPSITPQPMPQAPVNPTPVAPTVTPVASPTPVVNPTPSNVVENNLDKTQFFDVFAQNNQ